MSLPPCTHLQHLDLSNVKHLEIKINSCAGSQCRAGAINQQLRWFGVAVGPHDCHGQRAIEAATQQAHTSSVGAHYLSRIGTEDQLSASKVDGHSTFIVLIGLL